MDRFSERLLSICPSAVPAGQDPGPKQSRNLLTQIVVVLLAIVTMSVAPPSLHATPVTYQLVVFGVNGSPTVTEIPGPMVQIGNNTYGAIGQEIKVTFTFQGDTSNVDAYSVPGVTGYEIRMGTASVLVQDSSNLNNVLFQGTFDPTAGIFVSIDNTNFGIGFGSEAVWPPTAPGFPGEPVYPLGYFIWFLPQRATYDLKSDFNTGLIETVGIVGGWSCSSGPPFFPCATPPTPLPLTNGETFTFSLLPPLMPTTIPPLSNPVGFFATTLNPMVTFSSFSARAALENHEEDFAVSGRFRLGTMSNGINPVSEAVTFSVNGYSFTLPPGSFRLQRDGSWNYRGVTGGEPLEMRIAPLGNSTYSITAQGRGSNLGGSPISIGLTIGDDTGTVSARPLDD